MSGAPALTVAIPTFNRARKLEEALRWADRALERAWERCELLVADNASTDETRHVLDAWRSRLGDRLRVVRHPRNLGLVRNFQSLFELAHGEWVWPVGDDDPVEDVAVERVLSALGRAPRLALVHLNQRWVNGYGGEPIFERFYPWERDELFSDGRALLERCLTHREGALMFITATVVRRDAARTACGAWPEGAANLAFPLYLNAHVAASGAGLLLAEPLCDCVVGPGSWRSRRPWLELHDVPEVLRRMRGLGYPPELLRALLRRRGSRAHAALALQLLARSPGDAARAAGALVRAALSTR